MNGKDQIQVTFRADASISMGTGHVMRCATLAEALREGGALITFICAESETKTGTILLKVKINYDSGKSEDYEIYKGDLVNFNLSEQEHAELVFQPFHKCDIGMGPGKGGRIRVKGGYLGIVIDARGRPIRLPEDKLDREEIIRHWENSLHRFNQ